MISNRPGAFPRTFHLHGERVSEDSFMVHIDAREAADERKRRRGMHGNVIQLFEKT